MCKRNEAAADPLLRLFLEQYHLNLLAIPRENAQVGDVYIYERHRATTPGQVEHLMARTFTMPKVTRDETLADVTGTLSRAVDAKIGLGLLEGFLSALGVPAIFAKAKVGFESSGARKVRFKFTHATRDSVDPLLLGKQLVGNSLVENHPLVGDNTQFFLTMGVARSSSISVVAEDERGAAVDLDVAALKVGDAEVGITVKRTGQGEVSFDGKKRLAFGIELYELSVDRKKQRLRLSLPSDPIRMRSAQQNAQAVQPAFIGGDDSDVFVKMS